MKKNDAPARVSYINEKGIKVRGREVFFKRSFNRRKGNVKK